jgi:regulator of protease activity HflC (stomatin/prohibitin superfamily)
MLSEANILTGRRIMHIPYDWLFIVVLAIGLSVRIVREDQRMVVLRIGRFLKVAGPGLVWLIPVIDRGIKVNLTRDYPGWQALAQIELEEKIKASIIKNS